MTMLNTFDPFWRNVADRPIPEITDMILSGCKDPTQFTPDFHKFPWLNIESSVAHKVLDFGAGMLRNTVGMLQWSPWWEVWAYDNPEMLAKGMGLQAKRLTQVEAMDTGCRMVVCPDWPTILRQQQTFDVTLANLVFQHLKPDAIRRYLVDLRRVSKHLVVFGRRVLDDMETPAWPIIREFFDVEEVFEGTPAMLVGGDPHDHFGVRFRA